MGRLWHTVNGKRRPTKEGYREMYRKWGGTAKYKAERAARNSARRKAMKKGLVHKGDGKDVDHIRGVQGGNGASNLRVMSAHDNRARAQGSRKRGSKRNKSKWGK